jgi:threonine dehydrogenase-like Zn-dependent dehydrogenase
MHKENQALAAVAVGPEQTELVPFDLPEIPEDAGLLRVEAVGVCGTDVSYYKQSAAPRILGHHVVGFVVKLGAAAARKWGIREGARVALEEYIPCGQCSHCRSGDYRSCPATDPRAGGIRYGATPTAVSPSLYGGFSQYLYLHPNAVVHRMPDHVPALDATFTLPLANGFEWISLEGGAGPGQIVVIQGPGQQGLACVLAAKAAGADCVIVSGLAADRRRLELARRVGADHIVEVVSEDLSERVREITAGKGADLVIDVSTGGAGPLESALAVARRGATIILGAYKGRPISEFAIDTVVTKTLTVKGVRGHSYRSVRMAVECIASGRFPLGLLHSHNYPLSQVHEALKTGGGEGEPSPLLVTVSPWQ